MSRALAPKIRGFCAALLLTACAKDILPPVQMQAVGFSLTPQGGVVPLVPGLVTLVVPESAVAAPANIVAQPVTSVPPNPLLVPGTPVAIIAPHTLVLQRPVTLVVRFASLPLPAGVRASELRVSKLVPVIQQVSVTQVSWPTSLWTACGRSCPEVRWTPLAGRCPRASTRSACAPCSVSWQFRWRR